MVKCIKCNYHKTKCINSRDLGNYIRRRRVCLKCGFRFTTYEVIEIEEKADLYKFSKGPHLIQIYNRVK
jgi:transcriptional repressor NrdR